MCAKVNGIDLTVDNAILMEDQPVAGTGTTPTGTTDRLEPFLLERQTDLNHSNWNNRQT